MTRPKLTVQVLVNKPIAEVWKKWVTPTDVVCWNHASPDWHSPQAENDLRSGGQFLYRMEAKDGSFGFDFEGVYSAVDYQKYIAYGLADGRQVQIEFISHGAQTMVVEQFDAENENPVEMQQAGWQAIVDNFKQYVETSMF